MESGRVVVGRILRVHGLRGEILVAATGDDPGRFTPGARLYLDETATEMVVVASARKDARAWLLTLEDRPDRTSVEDLIGRVLYQDASTLPPLPEGEYYHFQLVGLAVTGPDGSELGRLEAVLELPGHDVYEVRGRGALFLVPARKEFVEWVDLERGEMRLTDREDLLEAQAAPRPDEAPESLQTALNRQPEHGRRPRKRRPRPGSPHGRSRNSG